jgi:hypothetical protein
MCVLDRCTIVTSVIACSSIRAEEEWGNAIQDWGMSDGYYPNSMGDYPIPRCVSVWELRFVGIGCGDLQLRPVSEQTSTAIPIRHTPSPAQRLQPMPRDVEEGLHLVLVLAQLAAGQDHRFLMIKL